MPEASSAVCRATGHVLARWRRIALGLLVAYAASMTLYASRMSAEVYLYRRITANVPPGNPPRLSTSDPLLRTARDFGADLTRLEYWAVRIGDLQGLLLLPSIVLFFLLGLGAGLLPAPPPSRSNFDKD